MERPLAKGPIGPALLLAVFAAAITAAIYIPSLHNGFVEYDDQIYIYENALIRSIDLAFLETIFFTPVNGNWHPLTMLLHALDYKLWGPDPFGHHLTSLLLHAANTFLVFYAARALLKNVLAEARAVFSGSLVTALLFGLHPLHAESVAWASELKDVLCAFFFLLSVLAYLKYKNGGAAAQYLLSILFFALSLMSKPMAVSLPFVLLILDSFVIKKEGAGKLIFIEKAPYFILSMASGLLTLWAPKGCRRGLNLRGIPGPCAP